MPVFTVNTNVQATKIPADFKLKASSAVAASLSKPESYVAVQINADQNIIFGGSDKPTALCSLVSIGALSRAVNKKLSKVLMLLLKSDLGIEDSRVYITFKSANKEDVGWSSTTFDDLM